MKTVRVFLITILLILAAASPSTAQSLRVATINVWSGLDYSIGCTSGRYETEAEQLARFRLLVNELREQKPDIIAIQESNPVRKFSIAFAESLDYDEIHQSVNGGIRIAGAGIPTNLDEGIAILAHPRLQLRKERSYKISGGFGLHGDFLSLQMQEANFMLVGKIVAEGNSILVATLHPKAVVPLTMLDTILVWQKDGRISESQYTTLSASIEDEASQRETSFESSIEELESDYPDQAIILLGDFNAAPQSNELRWLTQSRSFFDIVPDDDSLIATWDPGINININASVSPVLADGSLKSQSEQLGAAYDRTRRRIDYILLNAKCRMAVEEQTARIFLNEPQNGLYASDHYGVVAELTLVPQIDARHRDTTTVIEGFPILNYDSDLGFGYGAKGVLVNALGANESLDVTLFHSIPVERWYRVAFSWPDVERRQGTVYPIALDGTADYDKYREANLFAPGNNSSKESQETYVRDPWEFTITASRGFTPEFLGSIGIRFKQVTNSGFSDTSIVHTLPPLNNGRSRTISCLGSLMRDTRNSQIRPSRGTLVRGDVEFASSGFNSDFTMVKAMLSTSWFKELFYPTTILAARVALQHVAGDNVPLWALSSLGGNNTLRGYTMDRFVDNGMMLINMELRFPCYRRLQGVLGYDAGQVWHTPDEWRLNGFHSDLDIGLRFVMETFVVRLDVGMSSENTGVYFNFGQIF